MSTDRERWDEKYGGALGRRREPPDAFVLRALQRLGDGRGRLAVDLAAGTGRHALELARAGWQVEAWDVSPVALSILRGRAAAEHLEIETRAVDLLDPMLVLETRFDLALVVDFLDRAFWRRLSELVRPGGFVIARTFTRAWPKDKPPAVFRLEPSELESGIPGFEAFAYEEEGGRAGWLGGRLRA